jgi:hypothetical protein
MKLASEGMPNVAQHYSGGAIDRKGFTSGSYHSLAKELGHTQGETGSREYVAQHMGFKHDDPDFDNHVHNVLETTHGLGEGGSYQAGLDKYRGSLESNKPGWLTRNAHIAVPAGLLGAGALYALHKRRKAADDAKQTEAAIAKANASALPVGG